MTLPKMKASFHTREGAHAARLILPLPPSEIPGAAAASAVWKRLGIVLTVGVGAGVLCRWCTDIFWGAFILTTGILLSCMYILHNRAGFSRFNRAGNCFQAKCSFWRFTPRGILLYRHDSSRLSLFLPWRSLCRATAQGQYIQMEDAWNDTFYSLPLNQEDVPACLAFINQQLSESNRQMADAPDVPKPVYFLCSPYSAPVFHYLTLASLWGIVGILCPYFWCEPPFIGSVFFALGGMFFIYPVAQWIEDYGSETYMGEELLRSRRGIQLRMEGGIRVFIPWSSIAEGIRISPDRVFLRLHSGIDGISISTQDANLPIPITRRLPKIYCLRNWLLQNLILLLLIALGLFLCYSPA